MASVVNLCRILIKKKKFVGLQEKLDVFLAADRLTTDEYNALVEELNAAQAAAGKK